MNSTELLCITVIFVVIAGGQFSKVKRICKFALQIKWDMTGFSRPRVLHTATPHRRQFFNRYHLCEPQARWGVLVAS